jgi:hypothetical protein
MHFSTSLRALEQASRFTNRLAHWGSCTSAVVDYAHHPSSKDISTAKILASEVWITYLQNGAEGMEFPTLLHLTCAQVFRQQKILNF